ncbi:MAG: MASE1 domain-containing protein, partial [Candidatus Binatia bacterium]
MTRYLKTAALIFGLAALYFCAGSFGLSLARVHPSASAVWPPSGIALAALLLWGYRLWPGVFLGAFLVNIVAQGSLATPLTIAAGNTLEAILGVALVRRFANGTHAFDQTKTIIKFFLLASIFPTAAGATVGVTSLTLSGLAPWDAFLTIWLTWWLGDAVGNLIVAPAMILWVTQPLLLVRPTLLLEAAGLVLGLVLVGGVIFLTKIPSGLEYFALVPILWGALRFGRRGAVTSVFAMSAIALWGTVHSLGPFATSGSHHSLLLLQVFMATVTVTALVMASVLSERRRLEQRLRIKDAVSRILAESPGVNDAAAKIIQVICETAEWELGAIWEVDRFSDQLTCLDFWSLPSANVAEFEAITRQGTFPPGVGLPGRVWSTGKPSWIIDVTGDSNFPRAPLAAKDGIRTGIGFPIKLAAEVVGVMECFSREIREPDQEFLDMAGSIGTQLGQFMERTRAEDALRESEGQLKVAMAAGQMGAWQWDLASGRITWSSGLEVIHGLAPGTFGGTFEAFKSDIHPDDLQLVLSQVEKTLASAGDFHVTYRIRRPDDLVRWVEAFGQLFLGGNGKPEKLTGICMDITERRQAEESLRAKEAQVRLITDTAPVMLAQCSRDERFRFVNQTYTERLGLAPEQIIGKSITEVHGEEASKAIRPYVLRVLNGETVEYETEVPYERIGRRFMRVAYVPERDASGKVTGWVSAISDITDRKQTEEVLRQRTRSLEILNQVGNALAGQLDLGKIVQMVTDAGREVSGAQFGAFFYNTKDGSGESYCVYALSGVPRNAFDKFATPRNTQLFGTIFQKRGALRITDVRRDPRYDAKLLHNEASAENLEVRSYLAVPVVSRSDEILGGLFLAHPEPDAFTDETENIVTAIAAQASIAIDNANLYQTVQRHAEELRKLIDTAPIGIAVATDAGCEHIWCNPELVHMLGTDSGEDVSKSGPAAEKLPFRVLRNGQPVAADDLPMQRACRVGVDILNEELEVLRNDGTIIHELCRATPLRDETGKVRGCIGIFLNMTDRKEAEAALQQAKDELARTNQELDKRVQYRTAELQLANAALSKEREEEKRLERQLRQAQKMESIGTLAGGIAHDFNNILNIIRGYASLLRTERAGDQELSTSLDVIDEAIGRGASTVRQLLAVGKESAVRFERVDLNNALRKLKGLLSGTLPRTIAIGLDLEPGLCSVMADPNQIDQV